jgi:hypothetical protein
MRRGLHIAISLMAVALLIRPYDCFAWSAPNSQTADCCLKGKCVPTVNSNDCCKNVVPGPNQLALAKVADHSSSVTTFAVVRTPALAAAAPFHALVEVPRHPPPRVGFSVPSLPLLI